MLKPNKNNNMKRLFYILALVLPMTAGAKDNTALRQVEKRIEGLNTYTSLYSVRCDADSDLCIIDSLNLAATNRDLKHLLKRGNSMQQTAAFVLICTRTENLKVRRKALEKMISDTTHYDYWWSDDLVSDMPVGGYCFSLARRQGWATDDQYAEYVNRWGEYDTWDSQNRYDASPDEQGYFRKVWFGWFSTRAPEFPGGQKALFDFIKENLLYPEEARKAGTEGRTICQFTVDEDGSLRDVTVVISSGDESLDAEAVRLINIMPAWTPGNICNRAHAMKCTVPFNFKLE